ncbi:transcriptional regulator [Sphingosinicella sp. YJ22]|uniref:winged helix-turn-helix domain-containing protein n=1 Tax=Sphingosinicella sp. YJ22 TaxID=1104780 RepID=UPI0014082385|nr:transcriptional regulator [Sphingosinicella sp. YJ22]
MAPGSFRFDRFLLDPVDRQLRRDGAPVELNARYLDALALLVSESGKLVSKDRFMDEVWRGVPVTDEALTQCVRTLRRQLGDDAARPRFIETVPKHGYRFIAPVERDNGDSEAAAAERDAPAALAAHRWQRFLLLGAAGTVGGVVAGFFGGLFYGFAGSSQPLAPGMGAASVLLVMLCVTMAVALIGAAGVAFGIAASGFVSDRPGPWTIVGGGLGGMIVGAAVKLVALDAFNLLLGQSPGDITGAPEGAMLGGAVGLGAWLAGRHAELPSLRRSVAAAAVAGGVGGLLIPVAGGRLLGGSLDLLARNLPASRVGLDEIGAMLGENGFGPVSQMVTAGLEGALFGAFVVAAMLLARRRTSGNA